MPAQGFAHREPVGQAAASNMGRERGSPAAKPPEHRAAPLLHAQDNAGIKIASIIAHSMVLHASGLLPSALPLPSVNAPRAMPTLGQWRQSNITLLLPALIITLHHFISQSTLLNVTQQSQN